MTDQTVTLNKIEENEYGTRYEVRVNSKYAGYVDLWLLTKRDVKLIKGLTKGKLKRLKVGQPIDAKLYIDAIKGVPLSELGLRTLKQIVEVLISTFKGLEKDKIRMLEVTQEGKKIIGRGDEL